MSTSIDHIEDIALTDRGTNACNSHCVVSCDKLIGVRKLKDNQIIDRINSIEGFQDSSILSSYGDIEPRNLSIDVTEILTNHKCKFFVFIERSR